MSRPPSARLLAVVVLSGFVMAFSACASSQQNRKKTRQKRDTRWEKEVVEAREMHDRGHLEEAERRYRKLLGESDQPDQRRYVRLQLARLSADRGAFEKAFETYRTIWSAPRRDSYGARAMFEASQLVREHSPLEQTLPRPPEGLPARGLPDYLAMRLRLVARYPKSTWAERSVESLADHYAEQTDWSALLEMFDALHEKMRPTSVAADILFTAGRRLRQKKGDAETALDYFQQLIELHPKATLVDDAEWEAAEICLERQEWRCALPLLSDLSSRTGQSIAAPKLGTSNSPYASRALYRLGLVHLLHLDDYPAATRYFRRLLRKFPAHRLSDDSAWHLAHAHRLADRPDAYHRALRNLVEDYPGSRHVRTARRQLEEAE